MPAPGAESENQFSWPQYARNREYRALIGTIAGFAVVWVRMLVKRRYGF
jgi:hypothetical protein